MAANTIYRCTAMDGAGNPTFTKIYDATADAAKYVDVAGDTMAGALQLPTQATTGMDSVSASTRKDYCDLKVRKAGDTMTGELLLPAQGVTAAAATRYDYVNSYVNTQRDTRVAKVGDTMSGNLTAPNVLISAAQGIEVNAVVRKDYVDAQDALALPLTGGTVTGTISLASAPTDIAHLTNKNYTDSSFVRLTGSTLTGGITLPYVNGLADVTGMGGGYATNKSYVDALISDINTNIDSVEAGRVLRKGDTMTGQLIISHASASQCMSLRSQLQSGAPLTYNNTPNLAFHNHAGTVRYGYIQGTATKLNIYSDAGDIILNSGGGQVRTSDAIYCVGAPRFFGGFASLAGNATNAYLQFYGGATDVDTLGPRYGYVGHVGHMHMRNERTDGHIYLAADGYLLFHTGVPPATTTTGLGPYERMRIDPSGNMFISKTNSDLGTLGHVLWANGTWYGTTTAAAAANIYLNTINKVAGERWIWFERNEAGLGSITQNGTTGTLYNTTSDYRMKNIIGPIVNACERLKQLKTYRVTWKGDPERGETDDFLAHEVDEVVPDAVTGTKDAVDENGKPEMQHLGETRLVPLTVAALNELIGRVEALEGAA